MAICGLSYSQAELVLNGSAQEEPDNGDNGDAWDMTPNSTLADGSDSPYRALWNNTDLQSFIQNTYAGGQNPDEQPATTSDGAYVEGVKTRGLKLTDDGTPSPITQSTRRLYQKIAVEMGETYVFSMDSRSEVMGITTDVFMLNEEITTEVGLENGEGDSRVDHYLKIKNDFNSSKGSATDNTFTKSKFYFTASTNTVVIYVRAPGAIDASTEVFIDNLSLKKTDRWTGASSTDWSDAGNWDSGVVPATTNSVVIPSGLAVYPTITSPITVEGVFIESGASLIANAVITGDVTYNRVLTANWHLVSSPVAGETIEDVIANHTLATGTGTNIGIAPYVGGAWDYQADDSTGSLDGQGYSILLAAAGDVSFTGTVNTADVDQAVVAGDFNLVGNPYTSYVNSGTLGAANTALLTEETVWLWNGSAYDTYNTGVPIEIAPGQGFFLETAAAGNVTFGVANQSHQADTFQREEPTANFELSIATNENSASTKVLYVDGKTIGFDNGYDSSVFGGVASLFNVYTDIVSGEESKLAIQTLPTDNVIAIPVGIVVSAGEEITFSAIGTNLPEGSELYLEDKETGEFTNLSERTYKVTLDSDANGSGRFAIHTAAKSLSTADVSLDAVSIYASSSNELTVSGLTAEGSVAVYSILGKQVASASVNAGSNNVGLPSLTAGVYVVKVTTESGDTTKKIILE